jgi:hypothetical protein
MAERPEPLEVLRATANEARLTANWLQSLTAEAQRAAVKAARAVQREKSRMRTESG